MTHVADLSHLALTHMAHAAPSWTPKPKTTVGPPAAQAPEEHSQRTLPKPSKAGVVTAKRRGGGGSWRAFVRLRVGSQKFTAEMLQALAAEYRALSPEQRAAFQALGSAGSMD